MKEERSWISSATTLCSMHIDPVQSGITGQELECIIDSAVFMDCNHSQQINGN